MSLPSRSRLYVHLAAALRRAAVFLLHSLSLLSTLFFTLECMSTLCGAGNEVGAATGAVLALALTFFKVTCHMLRAQISSFVLFLFHIPVSLLSHFTLFQKAVRCVPNNAPQCAFSH